MSEIWLSPMSMVEDGKQAGQLEENWTLYCGGVVAAYGTCLLSFLRKGQKLVKQGTTIPLFGVVVPNVLQHVSWVDLSSTQAAPCTESGAKSAIRQKLFKVARREHAVQVRKVQGQRGAKHLEVQPQCMCQDEFIASILKLVEVVVNKQCQLREDGANMWCRGWPEAGTGQVP